MFVGRTCVAAALADEFRSADARAYHLAKQRREIPASAATCAIGRPAVDPLA